MNEFLQLETLSYYIPGIIAFFIFYIDDFVLEFKKPKNERKKWYQWVRLVLISLTSITIGILLSLLLIENNLWAILISILCGIFGGIIMIKIDDKKEQLSNRVIKVIECKIDSFAISKNTSSDDVMKFLNSVNDTDVHNDKKLVEFESISDKQEYSQIDFVDENQSPYNPFEEEFNNENR